MQSIKKNQSGFSAVEILVVIVIVGLLCVVGWLVYDRQKKNSVKTTPTQTVQQDTKKEEAPKQEAKSNVPEGWVQYKDAQTGLTLYYPKTITGEFKLKTYGINEDVHLGYGAPVWLRYSEKDDKWQTVGYGPNATTADAPKVPIDNNFKVSSNKVSGKTAILATTGDGGAGQNLILFNYKGKLYEVFYPALLWDIDNAATSANTDKQNTIQKDSFDEIVKHIEFK